MTNVLEVRDLVVTFDRRSVVPAWRRHVRVLDGVTFAVARGQTLGIVGESGSGKSTAARAVVQLVRPQSGEILINGVNVLRLRGKELKSARRSVQMVFQDPYSTLDPTMTVAECIAEPLVVQSVGTPSSRRAAVAELLEQVSLPGEVASLRPTQLSGGQRQRVAIARAICLNPDLVVCDEPVSALDVSTQNRIMHLLAELREHRGISFVLISHNLAAVQQVADVVAVMYCGWIVEVGPAQRVTTDPRHPYTQALLAAVPYPDPVVQRERQRALMPGEPASPADRPPGCVFQSRCPRVMPVCRRVTPKPHTVGENRQVACHLYEPEQAS